MDYPLSHSILHKDLMNRKGYTEIQQHNYFTFTYIEYIYYDVVTLYFRKDSFCFFSLGWYEKDWSIHS